jgi:4'-phosphopantetheinyl transferase
VLYLYKNPENIPQATFERALALLPAGRREAILRHRQPADRRRMLVASLLLIAGLRGEYAAAGIPDIRLSAKGKPELAAGFPYFSISHSGDYVGCALADAPVGLDIQQITAVNDAVIRRVCTREEQASVGTPEQFCALWTQKESVAKLTGGGITDDFKNVLLNHPDARTCTRQLDARHYLSVSQWADGVIPG